MIKNLIIISSVLLFHSAQAAHIVIIGCGYVGLTCAAILTNARHTVRCVDTDADKIAMLQSKNLPFYEPGLSELLFDPRSSDLITFATTLDIYTNPDVYYI